MAEVIIMPKLGFNMDEGQLVKWCKKEGEAVKKGEVLFEINTDKTTMPVEATADGVVLKLLVAEGDYVDVFTPIAVIGAADEDADAILAAYGDGGGAPAVSEVAETMAVQEAVPVVIKADLTVLKIAPRAKKYMKENNIDPASVVDIVGTGYQGGICEKDIKVSPLAKKLAAKTTVDLAGVTGSGVNGKVMKVDVELAVAAPTQTDSLLKVQKEVPYKGIRKVIGDRLSQSKFTAPHLYFTDEVDTTELTAFRKMLNETSEEKVSISDLLILTASKALRKYPEINASLQKDKIIFYESTNVGIAVAGENGLVVPVVKNAQEKSITAIAKETKDLIARARIGHLSPHEMGGTFTISNLGMFGIDNFTAIINPPESAILSVSSVKKKAVVITKNEEDRIVIRPVMNIQLSVDHRIIDGLQAAQFVGYFKELLENPIKIVL